MIDPGIRPQATTARAAMLAGVLVLAGCALGPDYHRAAMPGDSTYLAGAANPSTVAADAPTGQSQSLRYLGTVERQWWHAYQSPALNQLIDQALKSNPNIEVAKANVRQALENVAAQRGNYWPQVQAGLSAQRQRNAIGVLSPTLNAPIPEFNLYTPQLSVSFVPDVLGANRRQVEALTAGARASRFELEATYQTLINNVIVAAVEVAGLREQIRATERIINIDQELLKVLHRSLDLGAISGADVAPQEAALAAAEASLPPLRHQLEVQHHALAALLGETPASAQEPTLTLDDLHLPAEVPLGLPSQLVDHRPDVRAAEEQLHAATALVGVAEAQRLPQFNISAGVGSTATVIADLFKAGTGFWSYGASLSQTLFAGGTPLHRQRAAVAAMDSAAATWRATALAAFQNVADALHAVYTDAEVLAADQRADAAALDSLTIARKQLELGAVNALALLNAEQAWQTAEIAVINARMNRLSDTAALFQALGGASLEQ